jgi:tRNA wybutosine-synthesizing protein 2
VEKKTREKINMRFKQQLQKILKNKLTKKQLELLPASYQATGSCILVKIPKELENKKKIIATEILEVLPRFKTVLQIKRISGKLRQPKITIIKGSRNTETIVKENYISYKIDPKKIMFSKGNLNERKRLVKKIKPNKIIIDMFAGIGYFSLALAKFSKPKLIYAIELNPTSFNYLKQNIKLNHLKNIKPIQGDCRKVIPNVKADYILMGYFPNQHKFIPVALNASKKGTIIFYHGLAKKPETLYNEFKKTSKRKTILLSKKKVKEFSPSLNHYTLEILIDS